MGSDLRPLLVLVFLGQRKYLSHEETMHMFQSSAFRALFLVRSDRNTPDLTWWECLHSVQISTMTGHSFSPSFFLSHSISFAPAHSFSIIHFLSFSHTFPPLLPLAVRLESPLSASDEWALWLSSDRQQILNQTPPISMVLHSCLPGIPCVIHSLTHSLAPLEGQGCPNQPDSQRVGDTEGGCRDSLLLSFQ